MFAQRPVLSTSLVLLRHQPYSKASMVQKQECLGDNIRRPRIRTHYKGNVSTFLQSLRVSSVLFVFLMEMEEPALKVVSGERRLKRHRKSRLGCLRCKAKRIKCSETRPQCIHCIRNAAACVYPTSETMAPPIRVNLVQNNHLGFSLHDMRLFHDFMTVSFPHLPVESEKAWLNDIPVIAQQVSSLQIRMN